MITYSIFLTVNLGGLSHEKLLAFLTLASILTLSACSAGPVNPTANIDYLWVFQQTQSQKISKDFVKQCEKNGDDVRLKGLTDSEFDENYIRMRNRPFSTRVEYDFNWEIVDDKVKVKADCYTRGKIQENTFRILDFEARHLKNEYELDLK